MGRTCRVVPKQWTSYNAVGAVIPNTRFVVFKTPLNDELALKIEKEQRFNVNDLFRKVADMGLTLGLVLDLTDTDRYYDKRDIEGMCVAYEKINCPGRGFVERDDLVDSFNSVVDNFLEANADNDLVIGVHCTNGVNRSGYLICRFLIDQLGWSSHDAIDAFEGARGYPIERGSYVQALHRAAKERRTKKKHKHNDEVASSEESEIQRQSRKRSKHKKKRRSEAVSGDENGGPEPLSMEAVWSQMALAIEQHGSMEQNASYAGESLTVDPQRSQSSSHLSADNSPFVGSTGTGDMDEDEEEFSGEQENMVAVEEGEAEVSVSKKRRERRQRLQKQFNLMRTGNFWKINEMQKELNEKMTKGK